MKEYFLSLFGIKPKRWFTCLGETSTPYGEVCYAFLFDLDVDHKEAESVTKRALRQLHPPSFYRCYNTKYLKAISEKEVAFYNQRGWKKYKMGRYTNKMAVRGIRVINGYFSDGEKLKELGVFK